MVFNEIRRLYITLDATDKATRKLKQVDAAANATSAQMQASAAAARKFRARLVAAGFAATLLVGATRRLVGQMAQLDRTFATIGAVTGATTQQMESMREEATRIGAEMPVRMNDAAEAFQELSYAGLEVEQQLEATNDVVELSIAGNIAMADAARTATTAMNAFNMEAEEVGQVTNTMAATFTSSALQMDELTQSLEYVMPSAEMTGQSLQVTSAAVGTLADQGLRGSRAGTSLERVLVGLSETADGSSDALTSLGMAAEDIVDEDGDLREMHRIFQDMEAGLDALGQAEGLNALQDMFGARGARAAAQLIQNTDTFVDKIGETARAEINATMMALENMDEEQLSQISATLSQVSDQFDFEITGEESTEEMISQLDQLSEVVSEEDLATAVDIAFDDISTESARILAQDLNDAEKSVEDVTDGIESMTTASDLADQQMESLWGRIEFIRGSLDALKVEMVRGMNPVLHAFFDGVELVLRAMTASAAVTRGFGLALVSLAAIMTGLTMKFLALATYHWMYAQGTFQSGMASYFHAAAIGTQNAALTTSGSLLSSVTAALASYGLVTDATAAAGLRNVAAIRLQEAAYLAKQGRISAAIAALTGYNASLATSNALTWSSIRAMTLSSAAAGVLAGAKLVLAGALSVATTAAVAFWTAITGGLWPAIAAIVGLIVALTGALYGVMRTDFMGWGEQAGAIFDRLGDSVSWVVDGVMALVGAIRWLLILFYQIGELSVLAIFWLLREAVYAAGGALRSFGQWLAQLPLIGPVVQSVIGGMAGALAWLRSTGERAGNVTGWLGEQWSRLGLIIGNGIRTIMPALGVFILAWNWLSDGVSSAMSVIDSVVVATLQPIEDALNSVIGHLSATKQAAIVLAAILFLPLTVMGAVAYGIYSYWGDIVGFFQSGVDSVINVLTMGATIVIGILWSIWDAFENTFPESAAMIRELVDQGVQLGETIYEIGSSIIQTVVNISNIFRNVGQIIVNVIMLIVGAVYMIGAVTRAVLFGVFASAWEAVTEYVSDLWDGFTDWMLMQWEQFMYSVERVGMAMAVLFALPFMLAYSYVEPYLEAIKALIDQTWDAIVYGVMAGAYIITEGISLIGDGLMFLLDAFGAIGTGIIVVLVALVDMFASFIAWIFGGTADVTGYIEGITGSLADMSPGDIVDTLHAYGESLLATIASGILSAPGLLYNALRDSLGILGVLMPSSDASEGPLSNLTGWGYSIISTIASGVMNAHGLITGAIMSALGALDDVVGGALSSAAGVVKSAAQELGGSIAGGIASGIETGTEAIGGAVNRATDVATSAAGGVSSAVGGAVDTAGSVAGNVGNAVGGAANTARSVAGAAGGAASSASDIGGAFAENAGGGPQGLASGMMDIGGDRINDITEDIDIHFDGEVHDAQKVKEMVEEGARKAASEGVSRIEDSLDMGTDAASDAASDVASSAGDALGF